MNFRFLPAHLRPGSVVTMQPVDASRARADYILDEDYLGQPKRDGSRIVIFVSEAAAAYQSRSRRVLPSLSLIFESAFCAAAGIHGPFILDGELVFIDSAGSEHRTSSQADQANATNGHCDAPVSCRICVFKALFANGSDLTAATEDERISAAAPIVTAARFMLTKAGVRDYDIEQVPTAFTAADKQALVCRQFAEGREGEVWIQRQAQYIGGKHGEVMVRTKYLEETNVIVTALTPTDVPGRPFGSLEVSVLQPDGSLSPVGKVGTGFGQEDANAIVARFYRHERPRIVVRHAGRTESGTLWHARFIRMEDA